VSLAGLRILQVGRHGEVALHQVMAGEAADVGALHEPAMTELAPDAEVDVHGVGRLQLVVERTGDGEGGRVSRGESGRRSGLQEQRRIGRRRYVVEAGKTRKLRRAIDVGWGRQ